MGRLAQLQDNVIVLTTDVQTSKTTQSFATTTAYFINKNWNLTSCVLETTDSPDHHMGIFVSDKIQETLHNYNTDMKHASAFIHNEASNAVSAGKWVKESVVYSFIIFWFKIMTILLLYCCRKDFMGYH